MADRRVVAFFLTNGHAKKKDIANTKNMNELNNMYDILMLNHPTGRNFNIFSFKSPALEKQYC
jgi:hypothetical protein